MAAKKKRTKKKSTKKNSTSKTSTSRKEGKIAQCINDIIDCMIKVLERLKPYKKSTQGNNIIYFIYSCRTNRLLYNLRFLGISCINIRYNSTIFSQQN